MRDKTSRAIRLALALALGLACLGDYPWPSNSTWVQMAKHRDAGTPDAGPLWFANVYVECERFRCECLDGKDGGR